MLRFSLVSVALLASAVAAHADSFDFSYTGTGITASGILTANLTATAGEYKITDITGTRNGQTITGLNSKAGSPDQLLYFPATDTGDALSPTFVDNAGFSYNVGQHAYNVFTSNARPSVVENEGGPSILLSVSRVTAVTPEPASLALLGTGLLSGVTLLRRRLRA